MNILNKTQKENVITKGIVIAHGYLTATGNNWDAQLIVYKDAVYFYNKRDDKLSFWDNEDLDVLGKPAYMYSEKELIELAKTNDFNW